MEELYSLKQIRMNSFHVTSQRARLIWSIITKLTFVRFFTSVNPDVTNWVLLLSKRFLAKRTLIKLPHIYRCSSLKNRWLHCTFQFELGADSKEAWAKLGWEFKICLFTLLFRLNFWSQYWHPKGFSPVWLLKWFSISYGLLRTQRQIGHAYCFMPILMGPFCKREMDSAQSIYLFYFISKESSHLDVFCECAYFDWIFA